MTGGAGRHAELAGELVEWREDLWQRGMTSRVVLVAVPSGWGRSTALDHLARAASREDAPVTLIARVSGRELPDEPAVQAAALRECLAGAMTPHRTAELLGLDRFGGVAQLGLGVGGLFVSGLAAAVGFLVAGVAVAAAGKAWDDSPAGQDGAVARAARAVAATSAEVPVVVIIDDADRLDQKLALTFIENLVARRDGHVLVAAAVAPGGDLERTLTSRARTGITEGLVQRADADPDMGYESRTALARELCPGLPVAAVRRIGRSTLTFAEVFAIAAAPLLAEITPGHSEGQAAAAVDAVISARFQGRAPSAEAVVIAWAGGVLHARQAARALEALDIERQPGEDVLRWEGLARLANPAAPQLAVQVAALATRERQAMAGALLEEALNIAADPGCGPVDRVVAAQAVHRVRADLTDRRALPRVQRELAAGLEALGEPTTAAEVAAAALKEWPAEGSADDLHWLNAAVLRLARLNPSHRQSQLVTQLIAEAAEGGASIGLEARIWAAIDLMSTDHQRGPALRLIDQVAAELDEHAAGLGPAGNDWRLLLAFHAGVAGHPAITQRVLTPC